MNRRDFVKLLTAAGAAFSVLGPDSLLGATTRTTGAPPRLVVLYAPCTVNKDFLSPYNPAVGYTPNLNRFAAESMMFEDVQSECGMSGPAYATLFSGSQADVHGIFEQPKILDPSVSMITETFIKGGYDAFFWGGHPMASYRLGYGKGVPESNTIVRPLLAEHEMFEKILKRLSREEDYRAFVLTNFTVTHASYMPPDVYMYDELSNKGVVSDKFFEAYGKAFWDLKEVPSELDATGLSIDEFARFNRIYQEQKWVDLSYSFDKTMDDLQLTGERRAKFIATATYLYKLNMSRLDLLFGRVLNRIEESGLTGDSLVAFVADHGELLYRDSSFFQFSHSFQLAPEVLAVPFFLRAPSLGVTPGRFPYPVRSIDVAPTIAGLCGITHGNENTVAGIDLSPFILEAQKPPELAAYSHTNPIFELSEFNLRAAESDMAFKLFRNNNPYSMWFAVKVGHEVYKLQKFQPNKSLEFGLFNLTSDPEEQTNLFDKDNEEHSQMMNKLFEFKTKIVNAALDSMKKKKPDIPKNEKLEKLKDMGYIK